MQAFEEYKRKFLIDYPNIPKQFKTCPFCNEYMYKFHKPYGDVIVSQSYTCGSCGFSAKFSMDKNGNMHHTMEK